MSFVKRVSWGAGRQDSRPEDERPEIREIQVCVPGRLCCEIMIDLVKKPMTWLIAGVGH